MFFTSCHTQACFSAWINCENLLVTLAQLQNTYSKKLTKVIDECALICMSTFHAMKSNSVNINQLAILCVGICEECADICEECNQKEFQECARICRHCSDSMTPLASSNLD